MKLAYTLREEDFVNHQLYLASKSARVRRNRLKRRLGVVLVFLASAWLFYQKHDPVLTTYFLVAAGLVGLFYPYYLRWQYRRHYQKYIQENYQTKIGQPTTCELTDDYMLHQDARTEGRLSLQGLTEIVEVPTAFYLGLGPAESLLLPKHMANAADLRPVLLAVAQRHTIPYRQELDWRWR